MVDCGVRVARDRWVRQLGQRMSNKCRIDSALPIKLFLEGKDDQGLVNIVAQQANASLAPGPELGCDVLDSGDTTSFHLAGDTPIEGGGVDDDGKVGPAAVSFADESFVETQDLRQMAEDFSDSDNGEILRIDNSVATGGAHAISTDSEEFERWIMTAQGFDEFRAVHFTGRFPG